MNVMAGKDGRGAGQAEDTSGNVLVPIRRKEPISTHKATMGNKKQANRYFKQLRTIADRAFNDKKDALAAEVYVKLLEHAVGKPKERHEIEQIHQIHVVVSVIPPTSQDTSAGMLPESAVPLLTEGQHVEVADDVRRSLGRCGLGTPDDDRDDEVYH